MKRQREQAKRERRQMKEERRAQRKSGESGEALIDETVVTEVSEVVSEEPK
jgi:hypothetical protein